MLMLITSTLITISSYSWLTMWMGLEINLLSIIPLMTNNKNKMTNESAIKYFITQTIASIMILLSIMFIMNNIQMFMMMNSAFFMKMGSAPFHFWFPQVMEGLNWMNSLIILTWQKIAPMIMLMQNIQLTYFSIIIIITMVTGGIMGLNQTSIRKLMAYSSINNSGWMISALLFSEKIWMIYSIIYFLTLMMLCMLLHFTNTFYMNQMTLLLNNKNMNFFFSMNLLSMAGMPPFIGFLPKWLTIYTLLNNNMNLLSIMMVLITLLTLYFYTRMIINPMMLSFYKNNFFKLKLNKWLILSMNFMLINLLISFSLMINL
uniref:NADH-ubiquinone oxidoreductase chain 2 n=1 Tax=Scydosella musawasensis TaxID=1819563 RepID=A0A165CYL0_9COLE|nr:NADH dehydrogenase subunit 2 [Scydosella musawasensis]